MTLLVFMPVRVSKVLYTNIYMLRLEFVCSCFTHFHSSLCKISQELSVFIHCTESVSQGQKEKEENSDGLIEMNKEKMSTEGK